jgi:hypothetical protein
MKRSIPQSLALLAGLAAPGFAGSVLRVEPSGANGAFTSLQAAVDAAVDGDMVLIETGTYAGGLAIVGKSLVVTADSGAAVSIIPPVAIANVGAAQSVTLCGITIEVNPFTEAQGLAISDCAGPVWIQDCTVPTSGSLFAPKDAVTIANSSAVVVQGASIQGQFAAGGLGRGIFASGSGLHVYASTVQGGPGNTAFGAPPNDGATAVHVSGGSAWIDASALLGGAGGFPDPFSPCQPAGNGGAALVLDGANPLVTLRASTLSGGPAGDGGGCPDGNPGVPSVVLAGTLATSPGAAHGMSVAQPIREGQLVDVVFSGLPGELVFLLFNAYPGPHVFPGIPGAIQPGFPAFLVNLGLTDGAGQKHLTLTLGDIGNGGVPLWEQALFFGLAEGFALSNPRAVLHLDAAIP